MRHVYVCATCHSQTSTCCDYFSVMGHVEHGKLLLDYTCRRDTWRYWLLPSGRKAVRRGLPFHSHTSGRITARLSRTIPVLRVLGKLTYETLSHHKLREDAYELTLSLCHSRTPVSHLG